MAVSDRGFGSMDPAKQKEIASKGGKAAHAIGAAYEWNAVTGKAAGRKGGLSPKRKKKPIVAAS